MLRSHHTSQNLQGLWVFNNDKVSRGHGGLVPMRPGPKNKLTSPFTPSTLQPKREDPALGNGQPRLGRLADNYGVQLSAADS
jgi:hypothetical protein